MKNRLEFRKELTCQLLYKYVLMPFSLFFIEQDYGHRVRLSTHANFKEFVLTAGLEFYPLGGDPKVLAECMSLQTARKKNLLFSRTSMSNSNTVQY